MNLYNLRKDFIRGWILGDFENPILKTDKFETCIKRFKAGETEDEHYHKLTKEITVVVSGIVKMKGQILKADDIIVIEPGEHCSFECIEDAVTVAVRNGSFPNDKYLTVNDED